MVIVVLSNYMFPMFMQLIRDQVSCLKKVMEDQGFSENEIIHVGDSVKADILGAKKVGINSIFIPRRKMLKRYLKKV